MSISKPNLMNYVISIVIFLSFHSICLTSADCTVRDPLVGIGYNIIYGNPDGDDDLAGRDPGLKYNYQILDITYDEGKSVIIKDVEYCVPDQATTVSLTSCSYDEETYLFTGTASYQEVFSSMVSVDSSYDNGLSNYEFSLSSEYESVQKASESSESVFFDKRAFCHESQSRYRIENVRNTANYGVSDDFYNAFEALPDKSTSAISFSEKVDYYNFLTRWGTHVLEESNLGGRRTERYQSTLTELYDYALETSSTSVSLGGEYNGFSTSVSLDISTLSESTSSSSEFGSYYKQISTGATLEYTDGEYWQIKDGDTSTPEPTQLYLVSIATVCEDEGYWSTIDELTDDTTAFLNNRCDNLVNAISNYSTYLELSEPSDINTVPITWPSGYYGLLKPTDGCPADTSGFSFSTGWRQQYAHSGGKHSYSKNNHFEGTKKNNKVKYYFCMKNVENANTAYTQSWPAGQYCIYMQENGKCPDEAFSSGYIQWGDKKIWDKKSTKSSGNVPAGKYKSDKTRIFFCCREDGSTQEGIYLPNTEPFYLIRKGDECQEVQGMTVSTETMEIDSEKKRTKKSGNIPYITGRNSYTMYYCYYEPE